MSRPVQSPAGIKRLEQNARRLRLWFSSWIYEVAGPRYALCCFVTHVETKSAPNFADWAPGASSAKRLSHRQEKRQESSVLALRRESSVAIRAAGGRLIRRERAGSTRRSGQTTYVTACCAIQGVETRCLDPILRLRVRICLEQCCR